MICTVEATHKVGGMLAYANRKQRHAETAGVEMNLQISTEDGDKKSYRDEDDESEMKRNCGE